MPIERDQLGTRIIGNETRGLQFYDDSHTLRHEIYLDAQNRLHIASSIVTSTEVVQKIVYSDTNTVRSLTITDVLTFGVSGSGLYQGTGSFETPDTGLKLWNQEGVGKLAAFNGGEAQVYIDTDGRFYAGGGQIVVDQTSVRSSNYVPGTSGWALLPDGSLEAQDATLRGTVYATAGELGDLAVTGTLSLSGTGKLITAASPAPRIEMSTNYLAGYSDATIKQFYLDASTGKAYCGAGAVTLDSNGVSIETGASQTGPATLKYWIGSDGGYAVRQGSGSPAGYAELLRVYAVTGAAGSVVHSRSWEYYTTSWNEVPGHLTLWASSSAGGSSIALYGTHDASATYGIIHSPSTGVSKHIGDWHVTGNGVVGNIRVDGGLYIGSIAVQPAAGTVQISQATSGDPLLILDIAGTDKWTLGVDDSDSDVFKINAGGSLADVSSLALTSGPILFLNENACADTTIGLVINQGGNDNGIIVLKSSDIAHGMTAIAETDTYGLVGKQHGDSGGLMVQGFGEDTVGLEFRANVTNDITGKTTAAFGAINLKARKKSGTGVTNMGTDANLVVIQNNETARFIFDAEGSAHADVEWTTYDDHDDLALLDDLQASFGAFVEDKRDALERLGIAHYDEQPGHAMVNWTRLVMLMIGALRQTGTRLARLEEDVWQRKQLVA